MKSSLRRPGHEAAVVVGDGGRDVDQLDAAAEAEAFLVLGRERGGGAGNECQGDQGARDGFHGVHFTEA